MRRSASLIPLLLAAGLSVCSPCSAAVQADDPKPAGLLPLRDYGGDLDSRAYLFDDWDGARSSLAKQGLSAELWLTQVYQSVTDGGYRQTGKYGGKFEALINFDLDRMRLLPGALVTLRTESRYGGSVNGDAGTLLPVNDVMYFPLTDEVDDGLAVTISEFRYTQFLSKHFGVFAGKFATLGGDVNEFAGGRGDTQFLSHTFLSASVTALFNPYSTLGGGVLVMPNDWVVLSSSVYSAADSSTTSGFDDLDEGWVWSSTLRGQYRLGGLPGGMSLTGQYAFCTDFVNFNGDFVTRENGIAVPLEDDSWDVFWNGWQYLFVEEPAAKPVNVGDGRTDLQGFGVFLRAATADRDTNPVRWVVSGGIAGRGLIPSRDHDSFGIGYGYTKIDDLRILSGRVIEESASRWEAYYSVALTPAVELAADLQYADTLLVGVDSAWIVGLRLRINF